MRGPAAVPITTSGGRSAGTGASARPPPVGHGAHATRSAATLLPNSGYAVCHCRASSWIWAGAIRFCASLQSVASAASYRPREPRVGTSPSRSGAGSPARAACNASVSVAHDDGSPSATRIAVTAVPALSCRPSGVLSGWARNEVTSAVTAVRGSAPSGQALRDVQRWANASNAASVACALASERAGSSRPGSGGPSRTSRPTARGWARAQSASAAAPSPVPSAESRATPRAWRTASMSSAAASLEKPPS